MQRCLLLSLLLAGGAAHALHQPEHHTHGQEAGVEGSSKPSGYRKSLGFGSPHPSSLRAVASDAALRSTDQVDARRPYVSFASASSGATLLQELNKRIATSPGASVASCEAPAHLSARAVRSSELLLAHLTPFSSTSDTGAETERRVEWRIRSDSYSDPASGLSHIYARAVVLHPATGAQELDIANADVNINVVSASGELLSYGNSLYTAPAPVRAERKPRSKASQLLTSKGQPTKSEQVRFASNLKLSGPTSSLHTFSSPNEPVDPRRALLRFLARASPVDAFGADLSAHLDSYVDAVRLDLVEAAPSLLSVAKDEDGEKSGMLSALTYLPCAGASASASSAAARSAAPLYKLSGAPLTTKPVHAQLAYLQVPSASSREMELELVWKMEVEMKDNIYEAYLRASRAAGSHDDDEEEESGGVLQVVDWVQSSPIHKHQGQQHRLADLQAPHWPSPSSSAKLDAALHHVAHAGDELAGKAQEAAAYAKQLVEAGLVYVEDALSPVSPSKDGDDDDEKKKKKEKELAKDEFAPDPRYDVFAWGTNDPSEGKRSIESGARVHSPASPLGWHRTTIETDAFERSSSSSGGGGDSWLAAGAAVQPRKKEGKYVHYLDTRGNNVIASVDPAGQGDWQNTKRPIASRVKPSTGSSSSSSSSGDHSDSSQEAYVFDFPYPWAAYDKNHTALLPASYADAATTQLFYINNKYHDLLWGYGFDEPAGNFQSENFGRGGRGGDPVIAFSQDGAGQNNADFSTPPDGSKPRMRMYTWDGVTPERDGDFEEGIVIHEYSHGLSTRLTGGPANSGCLGFGEAGGFGEGQGEREPTCSVSLS